MPDVLDYTTNEGLFDRLCEAREQRVNLNSSLDDSLRRYTGPLFKGNSLGPSDGVDSHEFEVCSLFTPQIVFDNPRAAINSNREGPVQDVARAMMGGANRWAQQVNFRDTLEQLCHMYLMRRGRLMISTELIPGAQKTTSPMRQGEFLPMRPAAKVISPRRTLDDPLSTCDEESLFIGHEGVVPIAWLQAQAKVDRSWDRSIIANLKPEQGLTDVWRPQANTKEKRNDVGIATFWCPRAVNEEDEYSTKLGYNGKIYTMLLDASQDRGKRVQMIRKPLPAFCHPRGPYVDFGAYFVMDNTIRLSPIVAVLAQVRHREIHEAAASRAAARAKRIVALDANNIDDANKINTAKDGDAVVITGLDKKALVEMELGGLGDFRMEYLAYLRQRLDRSASLDDAARGSVTGQGTATENQIAFQATSARMGYLKRRFNDCTRDAYDRACHLMFHESRIAYPLGDEAREQMGPMFDLLAQLLPSTPEGPVMPTKDLWFYGGVPGNDTGYSYADLELMIEPESMGRTSESTQQRNLQTMSAFQAEVVPFLAMNPFIRAKDYVTAWGDFTNFPNISRFFDWPMFQQFLGVMQQQQANARLAEDVGGIREPQIPMLPQGQPSARSQMMQGRGSPGARGPGGGGQKQGGQRTVEAKARVVNRGGGAKVGSAR